MKFVAIDFETANQSDESICAAAMAIFSDGRLVGLQHWLIRPPRDFDWFSPDWTQSIHGIGRADVQNSPYFPGVAELLFPQLASADLVIAHNAAFDLRKLLATARLFNLAVPPFDCLCTLALARRVWPELARHTLDALCAHIGHRGNHHHAGADAEAAGRLLLAMMAATKTATPRALAKKVGLQPRSVPDR
ncbi:MAG: exonuclease domain-containing protein [Phycisphaerae bacterium]